LKKEKSVTTYKSPIHKSVSITPTDYWNDSCSIEELTYAIEHGAVGATTNPTIVMQVLQKEFHLWEPRIHTIINENPSWSEVEITWKLIEEIALKGAELLYPVFERENGKKGRLSIQTNPANYRNANMVLQQAVHFNRLAPNMQVKIPCTKAGIAAMEEATFQGVSINATVNFTLSQSLAVAEAVERGLERRTAEGKDVSQYESSLYYYGWTCRRLDARTRQPGRYHCSPLCVPLGWGCDHEKGLYDLSGARLSDPIVNCSVPPSFALVSIDWW
jgi:hypothetical protein